jgi:diguanylate cyclase (GGDEF)-like protein
VFRYGGEEFLIILINADMATSCNVAEKLRSEVETKTGVTISLGIAIYEESVPGSAELIKRADEALYRAKEMGRNRVEVMIHG